MKFNDKSLRIGMAVFASLIVAIIGLDAILGMLGTATKGRCSLAHFVSLMDKWQTLITGLLTLLTAGFAAQYVVAQMRLTKELDDSTNSRNRRAWLAMMPQAMSSVCEYAASSYEELCKQHAIATQGAGLTSATNPTPHPPAIDEKIFSEIRSMIECAESQNEADSYAKLLSKIQIHRVRWSGRLRDLAKPHGNITSMTLENEMLQAAELYARASNLLGAARPDPIFDDLRPTSRARALFLMSMGRDPIRTVSESASRLDESSPLPAPGTAPLRSPASH